MLTPTEDESAPLDDFEMVAAMAVEPEEREFRLEAHEHAQRLDRVLAGRIPEFSRSHLQALIDAGAVKLDGAAARAPARKVRAGQRLAIRLVLPAESQAFRPEAMELNVIYLDQAICIINKPAGLVVHPAPGHWTGTLLNGLLAFDPHSAHLPRAGIVHRLDKDTSGLMVVARSLQAMTSLVRDLAQHEVRRRYAALVCGSLDASVFRVDSPVGRDPVSRVKMAVSASGKPARTDVHVLASKGGISAIHCQLHTGRTHQIRVHLASLGHPLVADATYGGKASLGMERQALHAFELGFIHPITRVPVSFEAPFPLDLQQAWNQIVPT